ncbi:HET-domain-containing protein, partial [Thozetella sp. PMI_491]
MPSVRLASSSDLAADTRYLTLSHCWGGTPSIVLTAATKARFHEAIPPALLQAAAAAVFSDAIHITRCLGFRYLWIDAICIAQDDGAEKDSEIAAMHEIYSNAVLNLSATCAGQGADGMIRERNGHSVVPYFRTMGPRENTAHGRRSGEMVFFADKWVAEVQSGPVNTRGWVFQERILAPRILHFGSSQLYWECGTLEASETHPTAAENSRMPLISIDLKKSLRKVARGSVWEPARCLELWGKLLSGYTNTRLTFPGDKLVAMSAIAHTFGDRFGMQPDDYACGLWKPHLPQACLWMISRQETRPASYRSPTWSWASVDGMV